jgi:N-acetylmuramoyl-L-alanine amidase
VNLFTIVKGAYHISYQIAGILLFLAISFSASSQESVISGPLIKTIVLDAGHGGKDPGNLGTRRYKTTEKDVALEVTLLVGKYLNENLPAINVMYTRKDDSYPELIERTEFANKNDADLFISIHCNANDDKKAHGSDTWVMGPHKNSANLKVAQKENASILLEENYKQKYGSFDPNSPESYLGLSLRQNIYLNESLTLAANVQDEFRTRVGRVDRGVKQSGFYVISFTTMPSILIEMGFLTNPSEEDFLNSTSGKEYMASAIYRAIKKYISDRDNIAYYQNKSSGEELTSAGLSKDDAEAPKPDSIKGEKDTLDINYRVQLLVSNELLDMNSEIFNGLEPISNIKMNSLYKYYFGKAESYNEAQLLRNKAKEKGYTESFIVSFNGEIKIDLQEALTLESKNKTK